LRSLAGSSNSPPAIANDRAVRKVPLGVPG
jgi:hypothetical protein